MKGQHLRVTSDDATGRNARVVYVNEAGEETDISNVCTGVTVELDARSMNTAVVRATRVVADLPIDLEWVVIRDETPELDA